MRFAAWIRRAAFCPVCGTELVPLDRERFPRYRSCPECNRIFDVLEVYEWLKRQRREKP